MPSTTLTATYVLPEGPSTTFAGPNLQALPKSGGSTTIAVASTTNFTNSGSLYVSSNNGTQLITYAGISGNNFTGCHGGPPLAGAPITTSVGSQTLGPTFNVTSTTGFPTSGQFTVNSTANSQTVTYTNITPTSFTGCSGGTGTVSNGTFVYFAASVLYFNPGSPQFTSPINQAVSDLTLNVVSTAGFANSGVLLINSTQYVVYNGKTGTSFLNVTGGSGTVSSGQTVASDSDGLVSDLTSAMLHDDFQPVQVVSGTNYDNALTIFFKMRGFDTVSNVYITYIVEGLPDSIPPSGHPLTNVTVMSSWIDDKIVVNDGDVVPE